MVTRRVGNLIRELPPQVYKTNPTYGRVFFALRKCFGLTVSACLLADVVEILARRTGWCFASREYLADVLGVSLRSIKRLVSALDNKGLIERRPRDARQLRTTARWQRAKLTLHECQDGPYIQREDIKRT